MESLLSVSENQILQSFLSVMDYDTLTPREWALLASGGRTSSDNLSTTPNSDHKDALSKATKDLMSLEPERWRVPSILHTSQDLQRYAIQQELHHRRQQPASELDSSFSFPQAKLQLDPQLAGMNDVKLSSPTSHLRTSSSGDSQHQTTPSHQLPDSSSNSRLRSSKRKAPDSSSSSSQKLLNPSSASSSSTASSSSSHTVSKHSSNPSSSKRNRASSTTSPAPASTTPTQKQPLLSPSQKKANHIQSEQKRRANIRRGYEALCETVPALREAIKQEEEEAASLAEKANGSGRRRRKKGGKDGTNGEKDKVDGRAGPRSENLVLTKSTSSPPLLV